MPSKRQVLERLNRNEFLDAYGLDIADRRLHALLVDAFGLSHKARLVDVLGELPRVRPEHSPCPLPRGGELEMDTRW